MADNDNIKKDNMIREKHRFNQSGVRLTLEQIKPVFEDFGYELISTEYINSRTPLEYICNKHRDKGIQKITFQNLMRKSKCPYCMIEEGHAPNHSPIDIYEDVTNKAGYIFKGVYWEKQHARIKFICNEHVDRGIQDAPFTSIKAGHCVCKFCNGTGRTTDDFIKIINGISPNIEILGEYTTAKTKIKCRCKIHDYTWEATPSNLMSGFGCKLCGREKTGLSERIPKDLKLERLKAAHGDDISFLSVPDLTGQYVKCQCNKCGHVWEASYSNLVKKNCTGCPKCRSSSGEKLIAKLLSKHGINYIQQKRFDDCKDIFALPFDFYLPDYNCCIEFDGEQHYEPKNIGGVSDDVASENHQKTVIHDKIKNDYCNNNNIILIRIPYWEKPNMEYFLLEKLRTYNICIE